MINKLRRKIFFILMVSISIVFVGTIMIFAYMNYNSTITGATSILERVNTFDQIQESIQPPEMEENIKFNSEEIPPRRDIEPENDLENTYYYYIENGNIINSSKDTSDETEKIAKKIYKKKNDTGIVDSFIYKTKNGKNGGKIVMIMKNENVINQVKSIYISSVVVSIIGLIIIYVIAKKVSILIVKPVEQTMEKQKQFISDASHELKTPLAVIEANADVLENQVGKSKWIEYIQTEIASMDKLINNLLLLAKVENSSFEKNNEEFNLSDELTLISSMFESMAYEKKIKINYDIKDNIKYKGYKEDIKHVISTLIENAIMHTNEDGNIYIELDKEKGNTIIQVKNEGEPIPVEERDKIFERFYRVDKSRNRKEKRYGLGLAIAKSIIDMYHGKIEVICKDGITNFKVTI